MGSCSSVGLKRRNFKNAGRVCPLDYRIAPSDFTKSNPASCETLYVVGGLYGNQFALDALEKRVNNEDRAVHVVLNGDIHWFDHNAKDFLLIEQRVADYEVLSGNVELELMRSNDIGVGCGCSYPECTSDADVSRSNRIHAILFSMIEKNPLLRKPLEDRSSVTTVSVGEARVAITHGDESFIGGWGCSRESMQDIMRQDELNVWLGENNITALATTHTCAPAALALSNGVIINNGSAGMPNFNNQDFGIATRISLSSSPDALYSYYHKGLFIEAVPLRYHNAAFKAWFDACWPPTSPAAISYRDRINEGPDDCIEKALLGGFSLGEEGHRVKGSERDLPQQTTLESELAHLMYFEDMIDKEHRRTAPHIDSIQINLGKLCNLSCEHCHVEAGPHRTEIMDKHCLEAILAVIDEHPIKTVDITGGAPEMNPHFEWLLKEVTARGLHVIVRSNLVILGNPSYAHLIKQYASLGIEVIASLPNITAGQLEKQRGKGNFESSITILKELNSQGYGTNQALTLNLVFNPQAAILPPDQSELEALYKKRLFDAFGISFNKLFVIANNPVGRYGSHLLRTDELGEYMDLLMDSFNPDAVQNLMCRTQLSVGYDGTIYDCDFNQSLELTHNLSGKPLTIFDYAADSSLSLERQIAFRNHCYACTAGSGSSCTGSLVQE